MRFDDATVRQRDSDKAKVSAETGTGDSAADSIVTTRQCLSVSSSQLDLIGKQIGENGRARLN